MQIRRSLRVFSVFAAVMLLVGQAVVVEAGGTPTRFGSRLTNSNGSVVQPANAPRECDNTGPNEGEPCTLVSLRAKSFDPGTKEKAPKDGTIRKVRLVAAHAGSFRLYFAKARPGSDEAKVVKRGPWISYNGDNSSPYTIENQEREHLGQEGLVHRGQGVELRDRLVHLRLSGTDGVPAAVGGG